MVLHGGRWIWETARWEVNDIEGPLYYNYYLIITYVYNLDI
jgi:hypothetical protein